MPLVEAFLNQRGLELSKEKTRVVNIKEGFDFLGQNVRKYNGKLLIKPAIKNVQAFLEKARNIIEKYATASAGTPNRLAQPDHPGMGRLPSPYLQQSDLQRCRPCHLSGTMVLGKKKAHEQRLAMDKRQVLQIHWKT